jgi:hypothetical protein
MRKVSSEEMARLKRRFAEAFERNRKDIPGYVPPSLRDH